MTLSDLFNQVEAILPAECRFDVSLIARRNAPAWFVKPENQMETLVEIDVWFRGQYHGIDAPTYQDAFDKLVAVIVPELGIRSPAPADERLAAMDVDDSQAWDAARKASNAPVS